ncbi:hypothetical protein AJ78_07881 [Emergomyces pasteurianus Ep9510]|uniref:NAD(P)-binding protein n=1 Tax=Emergomyces pasteurianus Ep9510 TaxID=1447872 RepID=A0A1J9Q4Z1_9EURO|nr:hypothetical protein AJ78_07881 [Emergomyces pasteurianus Ep9510]
MPTYVITGANRGIGFEFMRQLSAVPESLVVGLVRDKAAADEKVSKELPGRNIHILQADLTDYDSLKQAAEEVARLSNGVDLLIANASLQSEWSAFYGIDVLAEDPKRLEEELLDNFKVNVVGNIHLLSLFVPLVQKGATKKVISLTSGGADRAFVAGYDIANQVPYAISKAGMNLATAKFSAQYKKDGILFMSLAPGMVDTGARKTATPEQLAVLGGMLQRFSAHDPSFKGPMPVEQSVSAMLGVIDRANIYNGHAGAFVSHHGNKHWL